MESRAKECYGLDINTGGGSNLIVEEGPFLLEFEEIRRLEEGLHHVQKLVTVFRVTARVSNDQSSIVSQRSRDSPAE